MSTKKRQKERDLKLKAMKKAYKKNLIPMKSITADLAKKYTKPAKHTKPSKTSPLQELQYDKIMKKMNYGQVNFITSDPYVVSDGKLHKVTGRTTWDILATGIISSVVGFMAAVVILV